jgi:hypothetical protein
MPTGATGKFFVILLTAARNSKECLYGRPKRKKEWNSSQGTSKMMGMLPAAATSPWECLMGL